MASEGILIEWMMMMMVMVSMMILIVILIVIEWLVRDEGGG